MIPLFYNSYVEKPLPPRTCNMRRKDFPLMTSCLIGVHFTFQLEELITLQIFKTVDDFKHFNKVGEKIISKIIKTYI